MTPDLSTTNALLFVMAAVSLLEAVALIGVIGGALLLYRRLVRLIEGVEARRIAPVTDKVNAILDDVKGVTGVVREATCTTDATVRWGLAWLWRKLRDARRAA
jgi:hypothetical protein